jgi:hypothetical protein
MNSTTYTIRCANELGCNCKSLHPIEMENRPHDRWNKLDESKQEGICYGITYHHVEEVNSIKIDRYDTTSTHNIVKVYAQVLHVGQKNLLQCHALCRYNDNR